MEDAEPGVCSGIFITDGWGGVGAAVIDDETFPVGECLGEDAVEASPQVLFGVVHRHDHRDGGTVVWHSCVIILLFVYFPVAAVAAADESDVRHLRQVAFDGDCTFPGFFSQFFDRNFRICCYLIFNPLV